METLQYYRINPTNQTASYEQVLGKSGNKKLPFNRKKTPAEPGFRRHSHLPWPVVAEGKDKRAEGKMTKDTHNRKFKIND